MMWVCHLCEPTNNVRKFQDDQLDQENYRFVLESAFVHLSGPKLLPYIVSGGWSSEKYVLHYQSNPGST